MGSTNDDDFITDETGSRRFLPFKVNDINLPAFKKLDIDEVWAEALRLYESNFVYWITQDDQVELEANNKEYINHTQEHEYVNIYCSVPKDEADATHVVPASVLRDFIQVETLNKNLRDRLIGVALSQIGFSQVSHRFHWISYPMKAWLIKLNEPTGNANLNKYSIHPLTQQANETKANTTQPNRNYPAKLDFKEEKGKK
jgi:predicted P-loop ATPase